MCGHERAVAHKPTLRLSEGTVVECIHNQSVSAMTFFLDWRNLVDVVLSRDSGKVPTLFVHVLFGSK